MKRPLTVAPSPITGRIYVGRASKDGIHWVGDKQDVTGMAAASVAKVVLDFHDGCMVVTANGRPRWEITVKEVQP